MKNILKKLMCILFSLALTMSAYGCTGEKEPLSEGEVLSLWENNIVFVRSSSGSITISGSGIITGKAGESSLYVVTNKHVVSYHDVILPDIGINAGNETGSARVIGSDSYHDIAVLEVSGINTEEFTDLSSPGKYNMDTFWSDAGMETDYTFGYTGGSRVHYSGGAGGEEIINTEELSDEGFGHDLKYVPVIQTSAEISAGMSGGAIVNDYGQLKGICTYEGEEYNYGVSSTLAEKIVSAVINGNKDFYPFDDSEYTTGIVYDGGFCLDVLRCGEGYNESGFSGTVSEGKLLITSGNLLSQGAYVTAVCGEKFDSYSSLLTVLYGLKLVSVSESGEPAVLHVIEGGKEKDVKWQGEMYKVVQR